MKDNWIDVHDEKPEPDRYVMVQMVSGVITLGRRKQVTGEYKWQLFSGFDRDIIEMSDEIVFWQPLPKIKTR